MGKNDSDSHLASQIQPGEESNRELCSSNKSKTLLHKTLFTTTSRFSVGLPSSYFLEREPSCSDSSSLDLVYDREIFEPLFVTSASSSLTDLSCFLELPLLPATPGSFCIGISNHFGLG